jgi:signal transduction histidine kinase
MRYPAEAEILRAGLYAPLVSQQEQVGAMIVHSTRKSGFTPGEVALLQAFANQAALAMENARQREDLSLYESVAWIGIAYTGLAHRITQKAGAIRMTVHGLKKLVSHPVLDLPRINAWLEQIRSYASVLDDVPASIRSLTLNKLQAIELNSLLRQDMTRWCQPEPKIQIDLDGLSPEELMVRADLQRIQIALEILADNAVRAMRSLPEKRLEVRSRVQNQRVVVDILNTGEVPKDRRTLLFNQLVSKGPGEEGTGIGALIVRYTMRHFGGDIELVQDSPQGVTHISFWLPLYIPPRMESGAH